MSPSWHFPELMCEVGWSAWCLAYLEPVVFAVFGGPVGSPEQVTQSSVSGGCGSDRHMFDDRGSALATTIGWECCGTLVCYVGIHRPPGLRLPGPALAQFDVWPGF